LVVFTKQTPFVRRYFAVSEIPELTAGRPIVSGSNKQYKELRKAAAPGGIKKTSRTLFSGVKIISELIASRPDQAEELIIYDSYATQDPLMLSVIDWFDSRNRLVLTKKSLFNDLDTAGSRQPLCVASVPEIGPFRKQDGKTDTMIALPFQDPVNTGTVIRSAAAFGLDAVMLTGESAHPFHTRSIRASAGTVFTARLYGGPFLHDLPDFCSENGFTPVTLDAAGTPLDEYRFPERFILIPGVEGPGLPEALKHLSVSVPISPGVESLNAAVSASVVMYEFYKRKLRTGI
ncbi:MAG: TrmH family RNA methyltransferase, partial [Spirochaetota bacterium]